MRILFCVLLLAGNIIITAQENFITLREQEEWEYERADVWSMGFAFGGKLYLNETAEFDNVLFDQPAVVNQTVNEEGFAYLQFSLRCGLDRYLAKGISFGVKLDYSYTDINDIQLQVIQNGQLAFDFDGGLMYVNTIGFVPYFEFSVFNIIEEIFTTDLPPYWDVYLHTGLRLNINIYEEGDLDIQNQETFVLGYELGVGFEVFLAERWSLRLDYSYITNTSTFEVFDQGVQVFDGDLKLDASRVLLGINYYF